MTWGDNRVSFSHSEGDAGFADLLDELVCSVFRDYRGELFQERPWKRFRKVEMERFVETLPEVLCDSPDIHQGWSNKVDGRDIRQWWPRRMKLPAANCY